MRKSLPPALRRRHSGRRRLYAALVAAIAVLALAMAYFAGVYWGAPAHLRAADAHLRLARALATASVDNARLHTRTAFLEQSLALAKASEAATRQALFEAQAKEVALRRKLAFYEGIFTPGSGAAAVRIAGLQIVPTARAREYRFQIVLVRASGDGRERVSGTCSIVLAGTRHGKTARLPLSEVSPRATGPIRFALRYFANLDGEFSLPPGFEPEKVEITIAVGEEAGVTASYSWSVFRG